MRFPLQRRPGAIVATAASTLAGAAAVFSLASCAFSQSDAGKPILGRLLTGADALGDWTTDAPGVRRLITLSDLPPPFSTNSANNGPAVVAPPDGAWPKAPEGFTVEKWSTDTQNPRKLVTAPNGDIFVAESAARKVVVLRSPDGAAKPGAPEEFASNMPLPFGIAFYPAGPNPQWVYVACTDRVLRFPYHNGDLHASGPPEEVVSTIPGYGRLQGGGHWTRDIAFTADGKRMLVSVGSRTNVDEGNEDSERLRALIYTFDPDGKNPGVYAYGIRNPVGLAIQPGTGDVWASVNERDGLGDNLVPDYITHVTPGGFYGWPWFYMGGTQDPRHEGAHAELKDKVLTPDILLESHSASLNMLFYEGKQFPARYRGGIFACEHGSWNRSLRTGYKVIFVPLRRGKATGEYDDFVTGFVVGPAGVWGRPVGITVASDGALLFSDDGSNTIWRVSYTGRGKAEASARG